jgi:hypothetical protein
MRYHGRIKSVIDDPGKTPGWVLVLGWIACLVGFAASMTLLF